MENLDSYVQLPGGIFRILQICAEYQPWSYHGARIYRPMDTFCASGSLRSELAPFEYHPSFAAWSPVNMLHFLALCRCCISDLYICISVYFDTSCSHALFLKTALLFRIRWRFFAAGQLQSTRRRDGKVGGSNMFQLHSWIARSRWFFRIWSKKKDNIFRSRWP